MKRVLFLLLVFAASISLSYSQDNNNLFWTNAIHVKKDKIAEFEKKLPALLKAHYPTLSFRVYEVLTGPNSGAYVVAAGPMSYKDLDVPMVSPKGDAARALDGQALDALTESSFISHARRINDISMDNPNRKIKYIMVTVREFKIGSWANIQDALKKLKAARIAGGSKNDYAIFRPVASGNANTYTTVRYFDKWEDMDYDEKLDELFDKLNGAGSWSRQLNSINEMLTDVRSELRVLRTDLSTMK